MKNFSEKLKAAKKTFQTRLRQTLPLQSKTEDSPANGFAEKPLAAAYQLIGEKTGRLMPLFKGLDVNLERANLKINFKAYVSLALLASTVNALSVMTVLLLLTLIVFHMSLAFAFLFCASGTLLTGALSVVGFYSYPIYRADKHKRELDDELPFTTGYMSILASAGVSPEKIFKSMSELTAPLAASAESKDIVKDINLFGLDIISALEKTSIRTSSKKFQEMIEGVIATIHTGSNLGAFLREKFRTAMRLRKVTLKKFSGTLSVLSELYVAILLTGPLLLAIMVCIMSVLGGGGIGPFSPELVLSLLTYIIVPVCGLIFLVILDSITPKW